jgi:hypothetical protein
MSAARDRPSLTHTILLTVMISTLTTAVIGSLLYYTLKRHELIHAQALEEMAAEGRTQQAMAAGRVVGALSRHVLQDVARLQELVETRLDSEGLQDVMIVSRDNVVLAAKNAGQVGQTLQDANWMAWKAQHRGVAQRAVDQSGRPVLVMVEPLKHHGDILAWAMLVFTVPEHSVPVQSTMERLVETGRLMAPIFVFLLISIGVAMKLAAASIRRQIQGLMASVLEEPVASSGKDWLRRVS